MIDYNGRELLGSVLHVEWVPPPAPPPFPPPKTREPEKEKRSATPERYPISSTSNSALKIVHSLGRSRRHVVEKRFVHIIPHTFPTIAYDFSKDYQR